MTATITDELGRATDVDTPHGTVRVYERGTGPTLVFVHGMSVDASAWRKVIPLLASDFRCISADWPFGAHRIPMRPGTDLSAPGIADVIASTLDTLNLTDVTLVGNDGGGLLAQLVITRHPERVGKLVLTNCDAYENFPPRQFAYLCVLAQRPMLVRAVPHLVRWRVTRRVFARSRFGFGGLHRTPVPQQVIDRYLQGIRESPGVLADFVTFLRSVDARHARGAAARFGGVEQPVLVAWAPDDPFFPIEYAHRMVADFPDARLATVDGSGTWVAEDRPELIADLVRDFAGRQ